MLSFLEEGSRAQIDQQLPCLILRGTTQDGNARTVLVIIVLLKRFYVSVVESYTLL